MELTYLSAGEIEELISPADAVAAIERALGTSVDPELDAPRLFSPLDAGEFLLMPASSPDAVGLKIVTIAPGNPAAGLPKIQALYVLYDASTLSPRVLLDGSSLTLIRTPATTAFAIRRLLELDPRGPRDFVDRLAVFGTGPQAFEHIRTLAAVVDVRSVLVQGRTDAKSTAFAARVESELGIPARPLAEGTPAAQASDLGTADVVVCASSTTEPLFDGTLIAPNAIVAAIGTHGLHAREVGAELLERADIVVEARAAAMREYGTLLLAQDADYWQQRDLANLRDLATGGLVRQPGRVALYVGVGMSWQDLVIVSEVVQRT